MLLHGHVYTAPSRVKGFDTNVVVTPNAAAAFVAHGYRFCIRYVGRRKASANDLTHDEGASLLEAGLGLMVVQHVESEDGWTPTPDKGGSYGAEAAKECNQIGVPSGVCVWCDLEGVALGTAAEDVVGFCNAWHSAVAAEGFVPRLYVGWHPGLNRTQLYRSLRFTHYWGAYNLNSDQAPAVRGLQMKQAESKPLDHVPSFDFLFQTDLIRADALGGRPTLVAPESWLE
jgi:hypothetical protein